jgi:hypothetical protein
MFAQRETRSTARKSEPAASRRSNAVFAWRRWLVLGAACSVAIVAALAAVPHEPRMPAQAPQRVAESAVAGPAAVLTERQPARPPTDPASQPPTARPVERGRAGAPAAALHGSRTARPRSSRAAAELLARGHYDAALAVYRELSAASPDGNVYGFLASVIERRLARRCAQRDPLEEAPCVTAPR